MRSSLDLLLLFPFLDSVFTPAKISGLLGWYDAQSIVGLNNGDAVSTWSDVGGLGNHATQAGSNRPTYATSGINSLPAVRFTAASSQSLRADGVATPISGNDQPFTISYVAKFATLLPSQASWGVGKSNSNTPFMEFFTTATKYWPYRNPDSGSAKSVQLGTPTINPAIVTYVFTGTQGNLYVNGAVIDENRDMDTGAMTVNQFAMGCLPLVTSTDFLNAWIGEMVVYGASISSVNRVLLDKYLCARWGVTYAG